MHQALFELIINDLEGIGSGLHGASFCACTGAVPDASVECVVAYESVVCPFETYYSHRHLVIRTNDQLLGC